MRNGFTRRVHDARCADLCVHELFAGHVLATPDRVALTCAGLDLTYAELDARAARLAQRLHRAGVTGNVPVGVLLDRSAEFVVAVLAILKAGGCYVPLDPEYPVARLTAMLELAGARVVVSRGSTPGWLAGRADLADGAMTAMTAVTVLDVEEAAAYEEAGGEAGSMGAPAVTAYPDPRPDDVAYIMFTSGSTGTPKAVAVRHAGIVRLVDEPNYARLDADQVIAQLSSVSFDAATFEIWGALANGARLVVAPPGPLSPQELGTLLREERVTCAWLTAGLFNIMVDECPDDLAALQQLLTGGDVMSPDHAGRFLRAAPHCTLINGYGPTEVTTFTACHTVTAADTKAPRIPIGRPVDGTWTEILDDDLRPVPPGVPGHLYAGGFGVARGYVGDAALTAERFVPDPWACGERLYATGDLATYGPDGTIDFLGRADQQLKKRGYRVEPAEIESALRQDPLVADAAVLLHGERADDGTLVACLVLQAGVGADTEAGPLDAIRERLTDRLPHYLLPDRLVRLDSLPLTPNGKVDRRALASAVTAVPSDVPTSHSPTEAGAPLPGTEQALAAIWTEILGLPRVTRDDDFFALGGQSLQASRMASRIRNRLGTSVPLDAIFDHPTIAELAELLDAG
ncbi:amino acid adenylation domain-containing protein [Streptomyces fradiae]|uniref:amino acid adenylation domain-containing protein n=1 Tax=Streptomyces fradiae TaxID=1906 RepID=UPI003516B208